MEFPPTTGMTRLDVEFLVVHLSGIKLGKLQLKVFSNISITDMCKCFAFF